MLILKGNDRRNPRERHGKVSIAICAIKAMDGLMSWRRMRVVMIICIRRFVFLFFHLGEGGEREVVDLFGWLG